MQVRPQEGRRSQLHYRFFLDFLMQWIMKDSLSDLFLLLQAPHAGRVILS